jgi:hypothetical protein
MGPSMGISLPMARVPEFVLEDIKMAFPLPEKQCKLRDWKLLRKIMKQTLFLMMKVFTVIS